MQIVVAQPELIPVALAAIRTVATARGELHPTQRSMLALVQKLLLGTDIDVDALAPITPEQLAAAVHGLPGAERIVRGMVLVCLARGDVDVEVVKLLVEEGVGIGHVRVSGAQRGG